MKWLSSLLHPGDTPPEAVTEEHLGEARQERADAQASYMESRKLAAQIRQVSIESRRIRADNQFSARWTQVFGSRPQGG